MTYASLDDLRRDLGKPERQAPEAEYAAKMLHTIPPADVVDRQNFLLERCKDKCVLELGASGALHEALVGVSTVIGVDREASSGVLAFDLDDVSQPGLPDIPTPDVILCGEVLEHLSNPGWLLTRMRKQYPGVSVIVTVPNAFSQVARAHMKTGIENVNKEHVCWFSFRTLQTLVERAGYAIRERYWYNGPPGVAEGLIAVMD